MGRSNRAAWLVLGSATLLGAVVLVHYLVSRPGTVGLDYRVYHVAAATARRGGDFYAVSPADSDFRYLYPPVTVLAFLPSTLVRDWVPGYLALTALSVVVSAFAARSLCGYLADLGHDLPVAERVLVGAFLVVSVHAVPSLVYGQVNHLLVAALVVGLVHLSRSKGTPGMSATTPPT